jgi:outer membrane protein TolC
MIPCAGRIPRRAPALLLAAAAFIAQGCSLVRPVSLTPPLPSPPPPRYVLEVPPPRDEKAPVEGMAHPNDGGAAPETKQKPAQPLGPWWTAFGDPALEALIQEALTHNSTLRDLRGLYHEDLLVPAMPHGPLWPLQIGLPVSVQRSNIGVPPGNGASAYSVAVNEGDVGIAATYQLDIWGQLDIARKDFEDLAEIQGQSAEAAAQNTAAQIASLWFDVLQQRALLELLQRQVHLNEDLKALVKERFELHLTTRLAVLQQEQLLLNTTAELPIISARLALLGSQLTTVLGRAPVPDTNLVPADRRLPELPSLAAAGRPADLVKNSPEVRLAQIRVAEAEHRVSQNLSGWLPVVSLFANAGLQAFDLSKPLDLQGSGHNSFEPWSFGARLTWPIFDGGQRIIEARQLTLTVKRRNMLYQQAFFDAVRRVQDAQIQEARQTTNVKTLRAEVALGKQVLDEARQLYEQGLSDYLAVLTANANLSDLERALILSERLLLSYRIELYRALGGTWSRSIVEIND